MAIKHEVSQSPNADWLVKHQGGCGQDYALVPNYKMMAVNGRFHSVLYLLLQSILWYCL